VVVDRQWRWIVGGTARRRDAAGRGCGGPPMSDGGGRSVTARVRQRWAMEAHLVAAGAGLV
jgi:hypothetical protein